MRRQDYKTIIGRIAIDKQLTHSEGTMNSELDQVFEVVDYTDDEKYYTLGIFKTIEQAEHEIETNLQDDCAFSEFCYGEYEEIQILKRKIGWSQHGKPVKTIKRKEFYDEDNDKFYWERV